MRGELDWIVMKALEKDRTRRYETANGLARDIERYLHDEPVEAGPPVGDVPAAEVRPEAPGGAGHGGGVRGRCCARHGDQHLAGRSAPRRPNAGVKAKRQRRDPSAIEHSQAEGEALSHAKAEEERRPGRRRRSRRRC